MTCLCPPSHAEWARAMRAELEAIDGDAEALTFALGCLQAALQWRVADWVTAVLQAARLTEQDLSRVEGLACALLATALGCALMAAMDAPGHYLLVHAATAGIAGSLLWFSPRRNSINWRPCCMAAGGLAILATACAASGPDDMGRWLRIGSISFQPAWILLPAMLVWMPVAQSPWALLGVSAAVVGVALQGDAMLATVVAVAAVVLAWRRRTSAHAGLAACAIVGLFTAWQRAPNWAAMPFIDGVVLTAFSHGPGTAAMTLLGLALLPLPGVIGLWRKTADTVVRSAHAHFTLTWGTVAALTLLDAQPAPVLGFGGSAVLGYFLAVTSLPNRGIESPLAQTSHAPVSTVDTPGPPLPRTGPLDAEAR